MSIYLQAEGLKGNATDSAHAGWVELQNLQFGAKKQVSTEVGHAQHRNVSRPEISEVTLHKKVDRASPMLFQQACSSKPYNSLEIHLCRSSERTKPYAKIILHDVMVSDYQLNTSGPAAQEQVALNFTKIEFLLASTDHTGKALTPMSAGYDLVEGRVC